MLSPEAGFSAWQAYAECAHRHLSRFPHRRRTLQDMNAPLPQAALDELAAGEPLLFQPLRIGDITVANRVVMAPLTRSRADEAAGDVPGSAMNVEYYRQR